MMFRAALGIKTRRNAFESDTTARSEELSTTRGKPHLFQARIAGIGTKTLRNRMTKRDTVLIL